MEKHPDTVGDEVRIMSSVDRPTRPFVVVDQNMLRHPAKIERLVADCRSRGHSLLLPAMVWHELSDHPDPGENWFRGLRHLARSPEFVVPARKITELIQEECETGRPVERVQESDEVVEWFRSMLRDVPESGREAFNSVSFKLSQDGTDPFGDHDELKASAIQVSKGLRGALPADTLKSLRKDMDSVAVDWLSSEEGIRHVFQLLARRGVNSGRVVNLLLAGSFATTFPLSFLADGLRWNGLGGLESRSAKNARNDVKDLECIALAADCIELASDDIRVQRVAKIVKAARVKLSGRLRDALTGAKPFPQLGRG